jgi:hypothetical protein
MFAKTFLSLPLRGVNSKEKGTEKRLGSLSISSLVTLELA